MTSLYTLTQQYAQALDKLYSDEELSPECIKDTLDGLEGDIKHKALNVAAYIQNLTAEESAIKEAEDRMHERRMTLNARRQGLSKYLLSCLKGAEIKQVKSPEFDIRIMACPVAVEIKEGTNLSDDWLRKKVIAEPDKVKIKNALKSGATIEGVCLVSRDKIVIN